MNVHQFANNPPDTISIIQSLYFDKYRTLLNPHILKYNLTTQNLIVVRNVTSIITSLQTMYQHTMFMFEQIISHLQIKLFQFSLVLEDVSDNNFSIDAELDHLKSFKSSDGDFIGINCDVNCDEKLLLYRDLVEETMSELCAIMIKVRISKDDVYKLYRLSVGGNIVVCGVCKESVVGFKTECGHDFCFECFVKCQSLKNACPVCRNVKSFKYIMEKKVNLLHRLRSVYANSKLSWPK